jgi:hypothetical protein
VIYKDTQIYPKVAISKLKIPLNQAWLSKKYKKQRDIILYHEFQEIKYRKKGFGEKRAHRQTVIDTRKYEQEKD